MAGLNHKGYRKLQHWHKANARPPNLYFTGVEKWGSITGKLCVKSYYDFTNDLSDDSYYLSMIPNPLKSSVDS